MAQVLAGSDPQRAAVTRVRRVAVATDRSPGGGVAVDWAANLARAWDAELIAIQVLHPSAPDGAEADAELLRSLPAQRARSRAVVVRDDDVAAAIVTEARRAAVDLIVIGSSGMRGSKPLLLGDVANRVTHLAGRTVVVVDTGTGEAAQARSESTSLRDRAQEIARVLGSVGARQLSGRVLRADGDPAGPRRLREAFEQLGPTFGKLGQVLSMRPDLLPDDYRRELSLLWSDVPPMSEAEVVAAIEHELGVPWEDVFDTIEPDPLAAGTIGQVHRARLATGERVVVKVRRTGAAAAVERDLELLARAVGPLAGVRRIWRVVDLASLVERLGAALREELDFTHEARNLERMAQVLAGCRRVRVPACHPNLSRGGLLVMDEVVGGVALDEAPVGPAREEAARELLHASYKQVLDEGFFHADPHPGNLLWAQGSIWLLGLNTVGRLDGVTRRQLVLILLSLVQGDVELLVDVSLDLAGDGDGDGHDVDMTAYREELTAVVEAVRGRQLEEIRLIEILNRLTAVSVRHGVALPAAIALVGKALAQVELTTRELAPDLDPVREAGRYVVRSMVTRLAGRLDPPQLVYELERLRYRLSQLGEGLATAAGNRPGRQLEVRFTSSRLERRVAGAGRVVGLGLGVGLTWVAATLAAGAPRPDPRLERGLLGVAAGLSALLAAELVRG